MTFEWSVLQKYLDPNDNFSIMELNDKTIVRREKTVM